jgi:hypothetical protein
MENKPKILIIGMDAVGKATMLAHKTISAMDIVFLDEAPEQKTIEELMKPEPFLIKALPILQEPFVDKSFYPKKKRKGNKQNKKYSIQVIKQKLKGNIQIKKGKISGNAYSFFKLIGLRMPKGKTKDNKF